MVRNDAWDQSWGYVDPATAAKAGYKAVSMYLSNDPSKNATSAHINAYHKHGIGVLLNWESQAGAPVKGASQGTADATEAVDQARKLKAPAGTVIYFSCDQDVSEAQISGPVAAYYKAAGKVVHAAGYGLGCYGEADLVHYLAAHKITDAEWQTLAWSGGRLDPAADFYQSSINNTLGGASVDFDQIIHPRQLGAWWPEGSPYVQEDDMTKEQFTEWMTAWAKSSDGKAALAAAAREGHPFATFNEDSRKGRHQLRTWLEAVVEAVTGKRVDLDPLVEPKKK
jgi:hypothetical protein